MRVIRYLRVEAAAAMHIRLARADDDEFILGLIDRFVDFELPPWRKRSECANGIRSDVARHLREQPPGTHIFVAEDDEDAALVGFLHLQTTADYFTPRAELPHRRSCGCTRTRRPGDRQRAAAVCRGLGPAAPLPPPDPRCISRQRTRARAVRAPRLRRRCAALGEAGALRRSRAEGERLRQRRRPSRAAADIRKRTGRPSPHRRERRGSPKTRA